MIVKLLLFCHFKDTFILSNKPNHFLLSYLGFPSFRFAGRGGLTLGVGGGSLLGNDERLSSTGRAAEVKYLHFIIPS